MTHRVERERFFHINRRLVYSPHPPLSAGTQFTVGGSENPFFGFYRAYVRQYPVSAPDGSVAHISALAFLRQVKDGHINPHNLPGDAYEIANHFLMLARELLWESVRLANFRDAPSRQRAIWLVPDLVTLRMWKKRLECQLMDQHQFIEVIATGNAHLCDASLLLGDSERLDDSYRKAREYWSGVMAPTNSEPEILFEGDIQVIQILDPRTL